MITTNFQKCGALVASLASILTLSSAAEAITFTSPAVTTSIGRTDNVGRTATIRTSAITNPTELPLTLFKSITINGLNLSANGRRLSASISLVDATDPNNSFGLDPVTLFPSTSGTGSAITSGNYTFSTTSTTTWPITGYSSSTTYALSSADFAQFIGIDLNGKQWQLDLTNGMTSTNSNGAGSLTGFSVDAVVPFDSNAAPAGVVIVFGALMLRRKLQQRSAQKMSLESVEPMSNI
jgi:hypothetical protein